jgi:chitin synthase
MSSFTLGKLPVDYLTSPAPRPARVVTVKGNSGNFVIHVPLSQSLLDNGNPSLKESDEFSHLTYTAVTKGSDADFDEIETFACKYQLRQRLFKRKTKIALVITMYNEDAGLFIKSMTAVQKNISYLCSSKCPFSWGPEGWKEFVIVIVADGRNVIDPRVYNVMELMGIFMNNLTRSKIDGKEVSAHIFEATTQIALSSDGQILNRNSGIVPTQVIFLLKEHNAKKINSHKWFFKAVCETIKPDVTMLLDVGTKPTARSLMHLWRAFDRNPLVGGACGEIMAEIGTFGL